MFKPKPGARFAKAAEKLKNLTRTVSSPFEAIRKIQYKKNRLDSRRTLKYSAKRKMTFAHKFTDYMQWALNLKDISERHGVNYKELIQNSVAKANKEKRGAIIVEFGPGKGRAINQASKEVKGKAKFFGFGDCADREWVAHKKVNYIQDVGENFRKYFPNNSVDVLFSHFGLAHVEKFDSSINEILPCLKVGGILKTDIFEETKSGFKINPKQKKVLRVGEMNFVVENTPYYFNKGVETDFVGRVLTFTRIIVLALTKVIKIT